jgi:hypothetical protein
VDVAPAHIVKYPHPIRVYLMSCQGGWFWGGPQAGDRAPDGPLKAAASGEATTVLRVLDESGLKHSLVLFVGGDPVALPLPLAPRVADLVDTVVIARAGVVDGGDGARLYVDETGVVHERFGAGASHYLVRPDGYIAFRGHGSDLTKMIKYLGRAPLGLGPL